MKISAGNCDGQRSCCKWIHLSIGWLNCFYCLREGGTLTKGTVRTSQKNKQLVLQNFCKTGWIAMLLVKPPLKRNPETFFFFFLKTGSNRVVKRAISLINSTISKLRRRWANRPSNQVSSLDHLMFSREFAFCLFISYARGCKFIGRHLKQTILWSKITWSAMGKTTPTSSKGLLLFDYQALTRDLILTRVFFCSKVFSRIIFPILFRVANHQIADKKN